MPTIREFQEGRFQLEVPLGTIFMNKYGERFQIIKLSINPNGSKRYHCKPWGIATLTCDRNGKAWSGVKIVSEPKREPKIDPEIESLFI